jgi:hypothetical protein
MAGYSSALFPQHAELLAASAIAPEVAMARGYRSVDTKTQLARSGWGKSNKMPIPGLLIPIHATDGAVRLHDYRPDNPRLFDGKPRKYERPFGSKLILDVHPTVRPQLNAADVPLWITEGSRKVDAAVTVGLCCIGVLGVDGWTRDKQALPDWRDVALKGRTVYVAYDSDMMTKAEVKGALRRLTQYLDYRGAKTLVVYLPHGDDGGKVGLDDYLAAGHTVGDLLELARDPADRSDADDLFGPGPNKPPPPPPDRSTLTDTVTVFRKWLYLKDPAPLYALAAALVANRAPGDPVWLLLVCAPSTGKTELLSASARLPWIIPAAKVTEASLLSGTSKRDRAKDATGGLLRQIGDFGVLLIKDFTSVLAQNKDARSEALAALREVYDGSWDRPTGADGGRMLRWRGKCGLIAGVTPAIDQYAQVVSSLGDRFVLLRMPDAPVEEFGQAALKHGDHETQMRNDLQEALAGLVEHADISDVNRKLSDAEKRELIALAAYTARARTPVARDGYKQEIQYLPQVEGPGRLVKVYARLLGGLEAIGCDPKTTWQVLARIATDCAPATRTILIRDLVARTKAERTATIATAVGVATKTASRYLEDLSLLGIAERSKTSEASNAPDMWQASQWLVEHWPSSKTEKYPPSPTPPGKGETDDTGAPAPDADDHTDQPGESPPYFSVAPEDNGQAPRPTSGVCVADGCDTPARLSCRTCWPHARLERELRTS